MQPLNSDYYRFTSEMTHFDSNKAEIYSKNRTGIMYKDDVGDDVLILMYTRYWCTDALIHLLGALNLNIFVIDCRHRNHISQVLH